LTEQLPALSMEELEAMPPPKVRGFERLFKMTVFYLCLFTLAKNSSPSGRPMALSRIPLIGSDKFSVQPSRIRGKRTQRRSFCNCVPSGQQLNRSPANLAAL